jgi:PilZ domain
MIPARKKREARKSVQQSAWITLDGGFATRPCFVLDLSRDGAKIKMDDRSAVQTKLRLAFARDARTGRNCEVVWRHGKTLGVKFVRQLLAINSSEHRLGAACRAIPLPWGFEGAPRQSQLRSFGM